MDIVPTSRDRASLLDDAMRAIKTGDRQTLDLVISCSETLRTNPSLARTIVEMPAFTTSRSARESEELMNVLIRSNHFDLSSAPVEVIRVLVWGLEDSLRDVLSGYIIGCALGGGYANLAELGQELEQDLSPIGLLLRVIVLRRPNPVDLVDWMIEQDMAEYTAASRSALTDERLSMELTPLRGLLLCLLYPTLSPARIMTESTQTGKLVGAYLGTRALL